MKLAIFGATGLVGSTMIKILEERNFPVDELIPIASQRSKGKIIKFSGKDYPLLTPDEALKREPEIALFSAGGEASAEWAPKYAAKGCTIIDNSSQWRMEKAVKLIIPEINGSSIEGNESIIANPNCSTIQMLLPLWPLHRMYKIKRIIVSTYQSVTGSGMKGIHQMESERAGVKMDLGGVKAYHYPIDMNIIPHIDSFLNNGYTKEEMKMVNETHKIFNDYSIGVSATTVRVPVTGGHSESVNVEFYKEINMDEIRETLSSSETAKYKAPGVILQDNPMKNIYPVPLNCFGKDEVFVGRIRRDESLPNGINMWIVADNLRKGAATNAVQIAEIVRNNKNHLLA
jgi:aspartate-semialdehyde dehydrogenase